MNLDFCFALLLFALRVNVYGMSMCLKRSESNVWCLCAMVGTAVYWQLLLKV